MAPKHESYPNCPSAGRLATRLMLSILAFASQTASGSSNFIVAPDVADLEQAPILGPGPVLDPGKPNSHDSTHTFTLRQIFHHGTYLHPTLHRKKEVTKTDPLVLRQSDDVDTSPLIARSRTTKIERLVDRRPSTIDPMVAAAREQGEVWTLSPSAWTIDDVAGPNTTDKNTILTFARMAADAYVEVPDSAGWENVTDGGFNSGADFGWQSDGLRGHVFADVNNSTIVIALKGTTLALWDGAETTTNDKENDNLFFSCCCAQQGQLTWRKVCDCATDTYTCNNTCLVKNLRRENRYYQAARELYSNVTALYPDSNVWVTGHSLGGAVSSLLGQTYGLPTVTFEAPGEALAAKRLGLPAPPSSDPDSPQSGQYTGIYHVGHTADPIYVGVCNGATGSCTYYGYAMETSCHAGYECVYDVVTDKGWRVGVGNHRIRVVLDLIKSYDTVPECVTTPECTDCALWKWFESNSSDPTTTSSSSSTSWSRTRTETCKTPGWWGCLDETTTTSGATTTEATTTSTSTSTSTCKTPGWFGCYDKTITTTTTSGIFTPTSTTTKPSSTTTCQTPGYFGRCNDLTSTSCPTSTATTTECETPGWFYGCNDEAATSTTSHLITSPAILPSRSAEPAPTQHSQCRSKAWFGLVCLDPSPTSTTDSTPTRLPNDRQRCLQRSWLGFCREWEGEHDLVGEI